MPSSPITGYQTNAKVESCIPFILPILNPRERRPNFPSCQLVRSRPVLYLDFENGSQQQQPLLRKHKQIQLAAVSLRQICPFVVCMLIRDRCRVFGVDLSAYSMKSQIPAGMAVMDRWTSDMGIASSRPSMSTDPATFQQCESPSSTAATPGGSTECCRSTVRGGQSNAAGQGKD